MEWNICKSKKGYNACFHLSNEGSNPIQDSRGSELLADPQGIVSSLRLFATGQAFMSPNGCQFCWQPQ